MSDTRTPPGGPPPADHAWVLSRLAPYWAGLLDDSANERVESHVASCEPCRRAWEAQSATPAITPGAEAHVPAALVADWDRQQRTLRGLERATVRHHLERCDDCRRDLQALGHEPVLEFIAALEPEGMMPGTAAPPAAARREVRPTAMEGALDRLRRFNWVLGSWAALATSAAAVMTFVLLRGGAPIPEGTLPQPGFGGPGTTSISSGALPSVEAAVTLVLQPGAPGEGPVALAPAAAPRRVIALQLRGLTTAPDDSLRFVIEQGSRTVVRQALPAKLAADSVFTVVLRGAPRALPPGAYRLLVGSAAGERAYAFRIAER